MMSGGVRCSKAHRASRKDDPATSQASHTETQMKHANRYSLPILVLVTLLLATAIPVSATYPGKNGRIAFIAGPDVYTMNPDGSDVKQLTNWGPDHPAFWESWSPDGKQIVFSEYPAPDYIGQLWLMNADGSN